MENYAFPVRRALHVAIPLAAVGVIAALRPEIVRGTFSSATSALRVGLLVAAWIAFSWAVGRWLNPPALRYAVLGAAGAGLLWFTVAPYFQEKTVDDELRAVAAPGPGPTLIQAAPEATPGAAAVEPAAPVATIPTAPVKLAAGQLRGLAGHRGSGEAVVDWQPDGSLLVRLEDFDVSSVPAPVLYVVPGAGREGPGGGIKLGALRGNQGNQNFTVPSGSDLRGALTVLIWCEAFSVPVAAATAAA